MRQTAHPGTVIRMMLLLACIGAAHCAGAQAAPTKPRPQLATPSSPDGKKAVLADMDHLLQLARELKTDVDKTRRDELSLQVIREADEIEKLARSVKARVH